MSNKNFPRRVIRTSLTSAGLVAFAMPVLALADVVSVVSEPLMLDKVTVANGQTTHHLVDPAMTHDKVIPGSHAWW